MKKKSNHRIEDPPDWETNEDYGIDIDLPVIPSLKKTKLKKEKPKKFKLDGNTEGINIHNKKSSTKRINN
jgi:hypothetical protein